MKLYLIAFLLITSPLRIFASENKVIGEAPKGYHWETMPEVKLVSLVPNGWYFRKETKEGIFAFFITKEKIVENEKFSTGFSANVLLNVSDDIEELNKYAASLLKGLIETKGVKVIDQPMAYPIPNSNAKYFTMTYEVQSPEGPIMARLSLSVDPTNKRINHHVFESPRKKWEKMQEFGKIIMNHVGTY